MHRKKEQRVQRALLLCRRMLEPGGQRWEELVSCMNAWITEVITHIFSDSRQWLLKQWLLKLKMKQKCIFYLYESNTKGNVEITFFYFSNNYFKKLEKSVSKMNEAWRGLTLYHSRWVSPGKAPPLGHLSLLRDLEDVWERQSSCCVCSLSTYLPSWFQAMATHLWTPQMESERNLKKLYTTVIHIARMPTQSSLSIMSKSPPVNSELVTVIICYLTHAVDVRGRAWKKGKHSGRLVPAGGKVSYLFRVFFTPLFSPRRGAPLLFNTQGLQTRTLWVCWSETLTHTHTRTHAGCVV